MKIIARVGERELALEVSRQDGGHAVRVEGRDAAVAVMGQGPFRTVRIDGRAVESAAWRVGLAVEGGRGEKSWDVAAGGRVYAVRLVDPLRAAAGAADAVQQTGVIEIRAVMPGKVVTLLAATGQEVGKGQGLLVVEAMKMENEITAPRAGRLTSVKVAPGEAVEAGALLATLE
jgi:biotin carboxyl carrier protein